MSGNGDDVAVKAEELGLKLLSLSDAQEELNEKLLSGWTMLNDTCPISQYPLVKNPTTGEIWSIRCQMNVQVGASDEPPSTKLQPRTAGIATSLSEKGKENAQPQGSISGTESTAKNRQSGSDLKVVSTDLQSKYLSEKLLKGWRMLEETCPITQSCPLMLDPATNRKWSAAVNDYIDTENKPVENSGVVAAESIGEVAQGLSSEGASSTVKCTNLPVQVDVENLSDFFRPCGEVKSVQLRLDKTGESRANYAIVQFTTPDAARRAAALSGSLVDEQVITISLEEDEDEEEDNRSTEVCGDDTERVKAGDIVPEETQHKLISSKLLSGWTMLEQSCPVTNMCPLLRDPEGRLWSAALNGYVDYDAVADIQPNNQPEDTSTSKEVADETGNATFGSAVVPEEVGSVRSSLVADSMRTVLSSRNAENRYVQELESCSEILLVKLAECRSSLADISITSQSYGDELAKAKQLIDIIAACGATLKQLDVLASP